MYTISFTVIFINNFYHYDSVGDFSDIPDRDTSHYLSKNNSD